MHTPDPLLALAPSVVIPTYQRRDLIGRAIESALTQVLPPSEVVVVDDGSTDGTREVVQRFADEVTYLWQPNAGVSAARNRGVRAASASWVAFLDSDDVWRPGHLHRIADAIRGTAGVADLYFADAAARGDDDRSTWFHRCGFEPERPFGLAEDPLQWALLPFQPMLLPASVVWRSTWLAMGGLREQLLTREDTHFFLRLALRGHVCAVDAVGVEITADSPPGVRLTEVHDLRSAAYHRASVALYADVLGAADHVAHHHRRRLRRRLADARWRAARTQVVQGSRSWRAGRDLAAAATAHPGATVARAMRRFLRLG